MQSHFENATGNERNFYLKKDKEGEGETFIKPLFLEQKIILAFIFLSDNRKKARFVFVEFKSAPLSR